MLLRRYLSQAAKRGFKWGEHDCILFAAGWAQAVCGTDPAADKRGAWRTEAEAIAYLEACGGLERSIAGTLEPLGWHPVLPDKARSGDVVIVARPDHVPAEATGIATDRGRVALITRRGLVVAPCSIVKAWRYHG